jgi:hypothetical protein
VVLTWVNHGKRELNYCFRHDFCSRGPIMGCNDNAITDDVTVIVSLFISWLFLQKHHHERDGITGTEKLIWNQPDDGASLTCLVLEPSTLPRVSHIRFFQIFAIKRIEANQSLIR